MDELRPALSPDNYEPEQLTDNDRNPAPDGARERQRGKERTQSMENIRVKLLEGGHMPERHGDWFDLATCGDCELKRGEAAIIPLGACIALPVGYEAHLVPRSSTFAKWGIVQTNGVGIIDNAYCGDHDEWGMPVYALRDTLIPAGTRICQFRIVRVQPHSVLVRVNGMDGSDRGGFGSTGVSADEQR